MNSTGVRAGSGAVDVHGGHQLTGTTAGELWRQIVPFSLVFLTACWLFFLDLGKFPLFNPDEGLFAEPAREILDTGEWTTSLLNYVVRFTKPPLLMWAMALSYKCFGVNEFAARFFGAACGSLVVAITYCFLSRYGGTRAALLGSSSLLVAPLFVGTARMAITDMPLTLFFSGCLFAFYRAFVEQKKLFVWLAYVLVGLAVMTKGPVAVLLPALILGLFHWVKGDFKKALSFYQPLAGAAIVGAIALPWFVIEITVTKGAYFYAFIVRENFQRFSTVVDSHKGAWWYHGAAMLGGYLPWSIFLPQALYPLCSRLIPFSSPVGSEIQPAPAGAWHLQLFPVNWRLWGAHGNPLAHRFKDISGEEALRLFAAIWAGLTLVFFSASVSKLLTYTLPAFPALAVLTALEIKAAVRSGARLRLVLPIAALAVAYGVVAAMVPVLTMKLRDCPSDLPKLIGSFGAFQCFLCLATVLLVSWRRTAAAVGIFACLTVVASAYFGHRALTTVAGQWEGALPDFARFAAVSSDPILLYDFRKPGVPFYTRRQVIQPASLKALDARLSQFKQAFILTKAKNLNLFEAWTGCRVVARDSHYLLLFWSRPYGYHSAVKLTEQEMAAQYSLAN